MVFTATRPIATCKLNGMEDGNKKAQMKTQTAQPNMGSTLSGIGRNRVILGQQWPIMC